MMEKAALVTVFVSGILVLLSIVMSLLYHHIGKKTAPYWELQRQLQELEMGGSGHPSEEFEFQEEVERRQAQLADIEDLMVWEERLRRWGLIVMYMAAFATAIALVLGGAKAFR
jgi:hypothetical protein